MMIMDSGFLSKVPPLVINLLYDKRPLKNQQDFVLTFPRMNILSFCTIRDSLFHSVFNPPQTVSEGE